MHLSSEVALELVERRAKGPQEEFWNKHIESCAECREDLRQWGILRDALGRKHLVNAPPYLLREVEGYFETPALETRKSLREVVASLIFDSFGQPAFAGARGAAAAGRQMVLRAEGFDIHIKMLGASPNQRMSGQVLPRGQGAFLQGARLHLICNGQKHESTAADKFGEFEFDGVPEGFLSLQVDLPHITVVGSLNPEKMS